MEEGIEVAILTLLLNNEGVSIFDLGWMFGRGTTCLRVIGLKEQ